jgi:hypothetical protein
MWFFKQFTFFLLLARCRVFISVAGEKSHLFSVNIFSPRIIVSISGKSFRGWLVQWFLNSSRQKNHIESRFLDPLDILFGGRPRHLHFYYLFLFLKCLYLYDHYTENFIVAFPYIYIYVLYLYLYTSFTFQY